MELKTFGGVNFDPKDWINRAWSSNGNQDKEVFVANTVSRLQLYMKQLTNSVDETTTQIINSIPRTLQDASALQLDGAILQETLLALEDKVRAVEHQTGHSIQSLQRIDMLKTKLETAASALREADKWAVLAMSLEDVLESGVPTEPEPLAELASQITAMTASLEVLIDAPDYETKRLQLETLYNRLEAAVSPPLIDALTKEDADRTRSYVAIFLGMARAGSLARCWRRAAAVRLAADWRRRDAHRLSSLAGKQIERQVDWLTNVLQSRRPLTELVILYTDLLLSLEPSPTMVVSAKLKLCSNPDEGILVLTELKQDIDEFIACIRNVIDAPSKNIETVPKNALKELGRAAHAPLRELLPRYTEMQTQALLALLEEPQLKQEDLVEQSRALAAAAARCEGWVTAAFARACRIAGKAAYPYTEPAVETFLSSLTSLMTSHARRIEAAFLTSSSSGRPRGVLCPCFPAALALEAAAGALLEVAVGVPRRQESLDTPVDHPLLEHTLLLGAGGPGGSGGATGGAGGSGGAAGALRRTEHHLRTLARTVLRSPIDAQLDKIPQLSVWCNNDAISTELPDFALSPQEYITEIGQYLMTLPQHLEMHLSEKQSPWQFLTEICTYTCELYAEKILTIRNMDALGTKRCLTDIVYLSSVVEDLGSSTPPALRNLQASLRAAAPKHADAQQ